MLVDHDGSHLTMVSIPAVQWWREKTEAVVGEEYTVLLCYRSYRGGTETLARSQVEWQVG